MNLKNIPRAYTLGFILLTAVVLIVTIVVEPGALTFIDKTDYKSQVKAAEAEKANYEKILAEVQPNYDASKQLLEKIATEDVIRKQVTGTLQTNQKVTIPIVADSEIKIAARNDRDTVVNYLTDVTSMVGNYQNDVNSSVNQVFAQTADAQTLATAQARTNNLVQNLRGLPVPKAAAEIHKANIVVYEQYAKMFAQASNYASSKNEQWSNLYNDYQVIDNRIAIEQNEIQKLSKTFALENEPSQLAGGNFLVKEAQAQFAVSIVNDFERIIIEAVKTGLAKAFAQFALNMIDKLVAHIEKNFAIASQLYYSEDLGRYYSVEYMKKFVQDPLDQSIIQQFLPQYFCLPKNKDELKKIFTAKAQQNRATDIVIDPTDPQFLQKLARLGGDEKNYPEWWENYYESLAAQTQAQADAAATKEVISPGLKSGRDIISGQINKTMSSIFNVQEAAIAGTINLGTNNTENVVSSIVSTVVESMVNKFIFTPIGGGSGGSIGVVKETNVCLRTPQIKPVTTVPTADVPATSTPTFNPR